MSRDVACVSYLGHAEIEGSEPSPGTAISHEERAPRATSPKWQCPLCDEPVGSARAKRAQSRRELRSLRGSEPSPGMFSRDRERQRAACVRTARQGSEVDESRTVNGVSEHVSAWFGALPGHFTKSCHAQVETPGHILTRRQAPASGTHENTPDWRRTRKVCASEASAEQEKAPLSP